MLYLLYYICSPVPQKFDIIFSVIELTVKTASDDAMFSIEHCNMTICTVYIYYLLSWLQPCYKRNFPRDK